MRATVSIAFAVVGTFVGARVAHAAACDNLDADGQNNTIAVLYIENGDTQEPLVKRIGKQLMQTTGTKLRIIYRNRPTCELADNFYNARTMATVASRPIRYIPEDPSFNPATSVAPTCDAPTVAPTMHLAIGATFLSSCNTLSAKPAAVEVVDGPDQSYGFIVNNGSTQTAITAEEAYLAFGFTGGTGEAPPWIDQNLRFVRGSTASTTLVMAAAMGLLPGQLKSATASTTSALLFTSVSTATDQQGAIGILGTELYDQSRSQVKLLAFKGFKQRYAYYPDSTSTSFDKKNVRDGHYLAFAPTPYIYEGSGGIPSNANVARVVNVIFGKTTEIDVNGLKQVIDSGLVPQCAMKVQRSFDGGDLSLYDPPTPCGCYFDKNVPNGSTSCTACTGDGVCGAGKCRYGYCESK